MIVLKTKRIIAAVLVLAVLAILTACGGNNNTPTTNPNTPTTSETQPSENPSNGTETNDDSVLLASYKSAAVSKLDELVNPVIAKIPDEELKNAIKIYYDTENNILMEFLM